MSSSFVYLSMPFVAQNFLKFSHDDNCDHKIEVEDARCIVRTAACNMQQHFPLETRFKSGK